MSHTSRSVPLKGCAFCDVAPITFKDDRYHVIMCDNNLCPVNVTAEGITFEEATEHWNRRVTPPSESGLDKALDHAEVIGNVTAALLDLDATYDGNRVTFTFQSTNDAMRYIHKARAIVQERLAAIRALQSPACSVCGARPAESCANLKSPCTRRS